jgi:RNA polymerase sigma-70 factor (ECF subfamily)
VSLFPGPEHQIDMEHTASEPSPEPSPPRIPTDEEIAVRVAGGETELFELLMRRHNTRVYRAIRSILRNEAEIEDAMQQAYLSAYLHLAELSDRTRFSSWIVRIAVNEALARRRRSWRLVRVEPEEEERMRDETPSPEDLATGRERAALLERAIDELPAIHRTVVMLRDVEGLGTAATAEALGVSEDVVKTRLRRARQALQERLAAVDGSELEAAFSFHATRCDRVVAGVMGALAR